MTAGALKGARCVVAGGAGAVGALAVELLRSAGADVLVVDVAPPPAGVPYVQVDVRAMHARLAAEIAHADVVVLAVPERAALESVPALARAMRPDALLVDTASVKTRIVAALDAHAAHLQAVSLNPMFAPALGFEGRAVAAVVVRDGPRARALLDAIGRHGAGVAEVGADEHDRIAAATQALTHAAVLAFGLALAELGIAVEQLDAVAPPPHLVLLAVLARIASGQPETYWDVQAGNPHARRARTALTTGVATLADAVDNGTTGDLAAILQRLDHGLGPVRDGYTGLCQALFAVARRPAPATSDAHALAGTTTTKRVNP